MKKRLEAELISIAHRILKLKGKEDLAQLHFETQKLYETLSVLKFVDDNIHAIQPKTEIKEIEEKLAYSFDKNRNIEPVFEPIISEEKPAAIAFDNMFGDEYKEPFFEKIDNLKMEIETIEAEIEDIEAEIEDIENQIDDNEMLEEDGIIEEEIIDKPTGILNISLNDRIGFVQHLFDNNNEDYNRVLSQLSTIDSFIEAKDFIENMVKPDYNDWQGKEDFEARFIAVVEQKFNS